LIVLHRRRISVSGLFDLMIMKVSRLLCTTYDEYSRQIFKLIWSCFTTLQRFSCKNLERPRDLKVFDLLTFISCHVTNAAEYENPKNVRTRGDETM